MKDREQGTFPPTGAGLVAFIDFAMQRGVVRPNTGANYKVVCMEVLPLVLGNRWRDENVFDQDVDWMLDELVRTRRGEVTPTGREHFQEQLTGMLELFRTYAETSNAPTPETAVTIPEIPTAGRNGTTADAHGVTRLPVQILVPAKRDPITDESEVAVAVNGSQPTEAGVLTYPFPLRPGVVAQLSLPVDLTTADAARLARFVDSLAFDDTSSRLRAAGQRKSVAAGTPMVPTHNGGASRAAVGKGARPEPTPTASRESSMSSARRRLPKPS
ncbi:MAG: hypothetical protein AB1673_07960 [Actinomycetota bacterium]